MLRGGIGGAGARGGLGSIDQSAAGKDWPRLLRPKDAGATFAANSTRIRFAGVSQAAHASTGEYSATTAYAGLTTLDRYFAIPEWFPVAGNLKRICWFEQQASATGSARCQLHIYSAGTCSASGFVGFPYPGNLVQSGTLYQPALQGASLGASGWYVYDSLIDFRVRAQTLLWFVLRCNASEFSSPGKWALSRATMPAWLGGTIGNASGQSSDIGTLGYGYHHTHTFTDGAASAFPQTAPGIMPGGFFSTTIDVPAIGYGFAAD
jgi:hypothetical protein